QEEAKFDSLLLKLRQQLAQADSERSNLQKTNEAQAATLETLRRQVESIEKESMESKLLFSTTSNVAYDSVIVLDEESTVIAYNKAATELFGEKNPTGEKLHDILNVPDLEDIVARAVNEAEVL